MTFPQFILRFKVSFGVLNEKSKVPQTVTNPFNNKEAISQNMYNIVLCPNQRGYDHIIIKRKNGLSDKSHMEPNLLIAYLHVNYKLH